MLVSESLVERARQHPARGCEPFKRGVIPRAERCLLRELSRSRSRVSSVEQRRRPAEIDACATTDGSPAMNLP